MRSYDHWIGGDCVSSDSADMLERKNPATGKVIARFSAGTSTDVDKAIAVARQAFDSGPWPAETGVERGRALQRLASLMRRDLEKLARLDCEEVGKPLAAARGEIDFAIGLVESAAGLAMHLHGDTHSTLGAERLGIVLREPVGVAAMITPWNFPACILCQKFPYALAAGCTVVVKPSELTSSSTLEVARLTKEAGIPDGVFNVVTGIGEPVGRRLAEHDDIDLLSFTGSTATGRKILGASQGNLKKVALELGGKGASIVFADADLSKAALGCALGNYANQGEVCCSTPRILVERSIARDFTERLVAQSRAIRVGDPFDEAVQLGALIHEGHMDKVLGHVTEAVQRGSRLLSGGERLAGDAFDQGLYMSPAVIEVEDPSVPVFQDEVFGPVMTVKVFDTTDEAVGIANQTRYGLSNSVWTKDLDKAINVGRRVRSGNVWINTVLDNHVNLPFGGFKGSGHGKEMGRHGLEEYTQLKSMIVRTD